jgi:hypothetical protein
VSGKKYFTTSGATYWIDLFNRGQGDAREIFANWVELTNESFPGAVRVLKTEEDSSADPPWQWVKFHTAMSVPWTSMVPTAGLPTRIPDGAKVESRSDTSTAADAAASIDEETDGDKKVALWLVAGGAVLAVVVVVASIALEVTAARKAA